MEYCLVLIAAIVLFALSAKVSLSSVTEGRLKRFAFFRLNYVVSGLLLGIVMPDHFAPAFENTSGPLLIFCLTWIGLFFGCHLELRGSLALKTRHVMLHIVGPVFVFFAVFLSGIIWLSVRNGYTGHLGTVLLIALFCTVTLFKRHRTAILEHAESIHPVVYDLPPARIVIPLVLYCAATGFLYAPNDIVLFGHNVGTGMLFFMLHIALGLGAGILASMIAAGTASIKSTAFALAAVTAFAGGITHSLALSPILVGTLTGVFMINSAKQRLQVVEGIFSAHNAVEKIFAFLMGYSIYMQANDDLAIAGMAFAGAVIIAIARSLMQYGLASLWIQRFHAYNKGRRLLWAALTGQGTVAAGLAVEYIYRVPDNPGTFILLASIVIVSQISTVFIIRSHY